MMISSTPFKVKLGLRDQGVGQVWKTNWSWQFQWTTSSCCSCMVLERILDVHLLPFKLCLMKSASMQVDLHKMLATWYRLAFTGWILNQRRPTMTFHHSSTKVWRWNGLVNFPRNLEEDEASQQLQEGDFSFNFSQQGQTVFYDRDFYVGQVLQVHNPDFADVTFMTRTGNDNIFKWPQSKDTDQVAAKYVFDSDSEVVPKNRTWQIDSVPLGMLEHLQETFCWQVKLGHWVGHCSPFKPFFCFVLPVHYSQMAEKMKYSNFNKCQILTFWGYFHHANYTKGHFWGIIFSFYLCCMARK